MFEGCTTLWDCLIGHRISFYTIYSAPMVPAGGAWRVAKRSQSSAEAGRMPGEAAVVDGQRALRQRAPCTPRVPMHIDIQIGPVLNRELAWECHIQIKRNAHQIPKPWLGLGEYGAYILWGPLLPWGPFTLWLGHWYRLGVRVMNKFFSFV